MIHLFKNIYLEDDTQIHATYELEAYSSIEKEHPLSSVFTANVGQLDAFEKVLADKFSGQIENFWQSLIDRNSPRVLVIYTNTPLFLQLLCSYWKSIFTTSDIHFFFQLYHFARIDNELKNLTPFERNSRDDITSSRKPHFQPYPILSLEAFQDAFESAPTIKSIQILNKGFAPIEYLIANHFSNNPRKELLKPMLKKQVLQCAWANWCQDIHDLKTEVISGFYNLHEMFPEIKLEFSPKFTPKDIVRFSPELQWVLDRDIRPDNTEYIRSTYPADFFPRIQAIIDKICQVQVKIKGIPAEDVDIFNQASQTDLLYKEDFETILKNDIQRSFGSFFLEVDRIDKVNHFLLNHIYKLIQENNVFELAKFELR